MIVLQISNAICDEVKTGKSKEDNPCRDTEMKAAVLCETDTRSQRCTGLLRVGHLEFRRLDMQ